MLGLGEFVFGVKGLNLIISMRILQFYANVSQISITTDLGMVLTAECSVRNGHFGNLGFGNL